MRLNRILHLNILIIVKLLIPHPDIEMNKKTTFSLGKLGFCQCWLLIFIFGNILTGEMSLFVGIQYH